jgi:putative ABC transport system permease protein
METLWQDLRFGARMLLKNPGFMLVAILTLGLGIGANTAIFSVINAVLLKPLPYQQPERLVVMRSNQSALELADIRAWSQSFAEMGGATRQVLDFTGGNEPLQIRGGIVTGGFFNVLGVGAALGRTLNYDDDKPGGAFVTVLSHALWQKLFNSDPQVLGKTLPLSGNSYSIVGVMPAGFKSPRDESELWVPLQVSNPLAAAFRGVHFLSVYLRLKPGVTIEQATNEQRLFDRRMGEANPDSSKNRRTVLIPLHERMVGETRTALWVLFGAVGLVLLIACVNFANLLLARGATREQELVVRLALGASRWRLTRQMLTESVLLATLGGAVGLLLAWWGVDLLVSLKPENLPRLEAIRIDAGVLFFALAVSVATGLIFGLAPAWAATRVGVNEKLKESGRGAIGGARQRVRSALVVSELALALILLVGAGLLIKSFWQLRQIQPGFNPNNLLTLRLELPESRYKESSRQMQFRRALLDGVNSLPGVQAALVSELPMSGDWLTHDFTREGWNLPTGDEPDVQTRSVMGDYFHAMQMPLLSGRDFTPQDKEDAPLVGIANQTLVERYFKNENPLGQRVRWARNAPDVWITIVGVVGDVKHFGLDRPEEPAVYTPYTQAGAPWKRWNMLVARTPGEPMAFAEAIKRQVWQVDPQLPVTKLQAMPEVMSLSFAERRFNMLLLGLFAAVALTLAGVGIYGVVSYAVAQRTREIGIRMALGAQRQDVLKMVVRQGMTLAFAGIGIGLLAALPLTRFLRTLLFGIKPTDPATYVVISLILVAVALAACFLPALRATKVDPMIALRYE